MASRQQIQEIPEALRSALEKARAEYGRLTRRIGWGDGPILVCGAGECSGLAVAAECAFESHLALPVVARSAEYFLNYGLDLFRPRSVLTMISTAAEPPVAQELAAAARERGCVLVVMTNAPESAPAISADHVFTVHCGADANSSTAAVCLHAAINFLSFETLRALKKPQPWWDATAKEFEQLPDKLEWAFTQLAPGVHSVAAELTSTPASLVGGGFLEYPARHAARRLSTATGAPWEAVEVADLLNEAGHKARGRKPLLFLSGSHSKMKKLIHRCADQAHSDGARVISMTDANDRALARASDLGILIPEMQEAPSSTLELFMLEWLAWELGRAQKAPARASSSH